MMKKIAAMILAALLLAAAGCASQPGTPANGAAAAPTVSATPAATPTPEPTPSPTPTPEPTPSPSPTATADPMLARTQGRFDGNIYTNDFYGFTFTKPDDFQIVSADRAEVLRQSYDHMLPFNAPELYISYLISHQKEGSINVSEFFLLSAKLDDSLSSLTPTELIAKVADDAKTVKYGGVDFGVANMNSSLGEIKISNQFCCTFRNGYVLMFVLMSTDKDESARLTGIMKTLQFK